MPVHAAIPPSQRGLHQAVVAALLLFLLACPVAGARPQRRPALHADHGAARAREEARARRLAVAFANGKVSASTLARRSRRSLVPALVRARRRTSDSGEAYFDITFTLAWLGYQYRANVERLMYPVDLWDRDVPRYERRYPQSEEHSDEPVEYNPGLLQRLYLHRPDPVILKTLFTWRLDGAAAEGLSETCFEILQKRPLAVLTAARHSRRRTENLIRSIQYAADPAPFRRLAREIKGLTRRADPRLRRYALRVLREASADHPPQTAPR